MCRWSTCKRSPPPCGCGGARWLSAAHATADCLLFMRQWALLLRTPAKPERFLLSVQHPPAPQGGLHRRLNAVCTHPRMAEWQQQRSRWRAASSRIIDHLYVIFFFSFFLLFFFLLLRNVLTPGRDWRKLAFSFPAPSCCCGPWRSTACASSVCLSMCADIYATS